MRWGEDRVSIVTVGHASLLGLLEAPALSRLNVARHVGASGAEVLALTRERRPSIVIVSATMGDISGPELCRAIRKDRAIGQTRVIIALDAPPGPAELSELGGAACDDVVVLPLTRDEFLGHLARQANLQRRRERRAAVCLPARVESGDQLLMGRTEDLSLRGARVSFEQAPPLLTGRRVVLRLGEAPAAMSMHARVVWARLAERSIGVEFDAPSLEATKTLERLVLWQVVEHGDGQLVYLDGDLVETTDLSHLPPRLRGVVDFDAEGVRRISPRGAGQWQAFLSQLDERLGGEIQSYGFSRCSLAFVARANAASGFIGRGAVTSLLAPYSCERCDFDELRLIQSTVLAAGPKGVQVPRFRCSQCGGTIKLAESVERYRMFLAAPAQAAAS
jgi:DNA-binding response OmpR family regulator